MNLKLYRITCEVDNGWSCEDYDVYVCASSHQKAIEFVQLRWNSSYDTTVEVKLVTVIPLTENGIICVQHLYSYI